MPVEKRRSGDEVGQLCNERQGLRLRHPDNAHAFAGADINGFAPGDRMRANDRVDHIGQVPDCRGEGTAGGVLLGSSPMDRP